MVTSGEETKDDNGLTATLGMAEEELATTLAMCELPAGANTNLLPAWMLQYTAKSTSNAFKKIIIRKHIMSFYCAV